MLVEDIEEEVTLLGWFNGTGIILPKSTQTMRKKRPGYYSVIYAQKSLKIAQGNTYSCF